LQTRYTGGTVLHLYMRERIPSPDACRRLVQAALFRFRLPYITVTPTFSICPKHGYLDGEHEFCPRCDEEIAARRAGGGRPLTDGPEFSSNVHDCCRHPG
jgi:ribonucleoside-triphosphate reductase